MKVKFTVVLFVSVLFFVSCDGYQAKQNEDKLSGEQYSEVDPSEIGTDKETGDSGIPDDIEDHSDIDDPFDDEDTIIPVPDDDDPIDIPDENENDNDIEVDEEIFNDEDPDEEEYPDEEEICVDECSMVDTVQCIGTSVVKCTLVDECMQWIEVEDCNDTERFCNDNNTIGDSLNSNTRGNVYKGTFIEATSDATVYEYSMDLDNLTGQPLTFAVYVSETEDGTYELLSLNVIDDPGKGRRMYNSGILKSGDNDGIQIENGKFYIFGAAWEEDMVSYYQSPFVSEIISFGNTLGGLAPQDSFPIPELFESPNIGIAAYPTKFNVGVTDTGICSCNHKCPENATRCNENWIEECLENDYGCLEWYQDEDCDYLTCLMQTGTAQCINTCEDECILGERRCAGNVLEECKRSSIDDCNYWRVEEKCSDNIVAPYCETLSVNPSDAECTTVPQITLDHIAQNSNEEGQNDTGFAKGVYVRADYDATITGFKFYISVPQKTDVYFSIYEGASESGEYKRIYRESRKIEFDETNPYPGYYGLEDISVEIKAGNFYFFQFWDPYGLRYYSRCSNFWDPDLVYPTVFGEAVGHGNTQFSEEPPETRNLDGRGDCFYRMWVESYLK